MKVWIPAAVVVGGLYMTLIASAPGETRSDTDTTSESTIKRASVAASSSSGARTDSSSRETRTETDSSRMRSDASSSGMRSEDAADAANGWSVKKQLFGKAVRNDDREKLGEIDDIIIGANKTATFAIVGVGGFLGMGKRDVAIPISQLRQETDGFVLPGATKEKVKEMPEFHYPS